MNKRIFQLSAFGLRNIISHFHNNCQVVVYDTNYKNIDINEDDFLFILGKHAIKMNRFLAIFISPRVSSLLFIDPTMKILCLDDFGHLIPNFESIKNSEILETLKSIISGQKIEIDFHESQNILILSILLGNPDFFDKIYEIFPIKLTKSHINECIQYLKYISLFENSQCVNSVENIFIEKEKIINFIAANFYLVDINEIIELPKLVLYAIIINEHLKLTSEDFLFDLINLLFENNNSNDDIEKISFYEELQLTSLSDEKFNEFIGKLRPDEITEKIWLKLRECFHTNNRIISNKLSLKERKLIHPKRYNQIYKRINFSNRVNQFKGIINYLGNGNPNEVIERGIISISSSQVYNNSEYFQPKNVVDFNDEDSSFRSTDNIDSWIMFDFIDKEVKLSCYTIRSNNWGDSNMNHLLNWVIEGSNDCQSWDIIDERRANHTLNHPRASNVFDIDSNNSSIGYYQYIRLRQTDVNTARNHQLVLSAIEFFGIIHNF